MKLEDMTLDVEQYVEVKADIGDVFKGVLHRFGEGCTNPNGESMQMILEQWPCAGDQAASSAGTQRSYVHVVPSFESSGATFGPDRRRNQGQPAAPCDRI